MNGISIIVCCYNAENRIEETLKYISNNKINQSVHLELIIVDNNSSDNTSQKSKTSWENLGNKFPIKILKESKQGLSAARKKGVLSAKYPISIFCDDDNWLDEDYIQNVIDIMNSNDKIGVLGGDSVPVFEKNPPAWFYDYATSFAIGSQADQNGFEIRKYTLWGGGMAFRTHILKTIYEKGIESLITDRKGKELTSGGDNEICAWFIFAGYKLYYSNALKMQHMMPVERFTEDYKLRFIFGNDLTAWPTYQNYLQIFYGLKSSNRESSLLSKLRIIKGFFSMIKYPSVLIKIIKISIMIRNIKFIND